MKKIFFIINSNIVFKDTEEEKILFNPATGYIEAINETAKFIFEQCNGKNPEDKIIKKVIENYKGVNQKKIINEVKAFLRDMARKDWIQIT